jgi:aspartate aminotransferase
VYGTYRTLAGAGERVVFGVPSWNNDYYCHMVGADAVPVECGAADAFLPTRERLEPVIRGARLLALNSPLNPCGTAFTEESLGEICDLVLAENARRTAVEGPLYVLYDHVYWQLTFGDVRHVDPVSLRPAMRPYTVYVDGISKAFAATGMRVGWVVGARLLRDPGQMASFRDGLVRGVRQRLDLLFDAIQGFRRAGHAVDAVNPMGAIYLSARFDLAGRVARDGTRLTSSDDVRRWLLREAGMAVVPFNAFGSRADEGWYRLSVGAVSLADIEAALPRLKAGLESLS